MLGPTEVSPLCQRIT